MGDENDDFWVTYIASTPEEDANFAGCGQATGWMALIAILGGLAVWFMTR